MESVVEPKLQSVVDVTTFFDDRENGGNHVSDVKSRGEAKMRPAVRKVRDREHRNDEQREHRDRKTISEVLHDIYDKNIQ